MLDLSIIIPVYNVEAYIEECLASVVAQSDAKANIECIIVDDCSPDGSMDIVRRFVDNYQGAVQFRTLRHEVNRGISLHAIRVLMLQRAIICFLSIPTTI